ncbi:MAG TPA: hypothetical protein DCO79_06930 [Spirochaeta sp.]|nr:hypothetical protein [Spirochaeta sp.]
MEVSWEDKEALNTLFETIHPAAGISLDLYAFCWKEEYAYDDANDIDYRLDDANRLIARGNINYVYDSNGNMTDETFGVRVTSYGYNHNNRLAGTVTVNPWILESKPETRTSSYSYDGLGRRVSDSESITKHEGNGILGKRRKSVYCRRLNACRTR